MSDILSAAQVPPSDWNAAVDAFRRAKLAERAYEQAEWNPAYDRWDCDGTAIPDNIEAELVRLQELRWNAEDDLMAIPSPDAAGLCLKLLIALADMRDTNGWDGLLVSEAMRFVPDYPRDAVRS